MIHVIYGLIVGHLHRRELGRILLSTPRQTTVEVDLGGVKANGCRAVAFDFDGVLAPHDAPMPLPETERVLSRALEIFGPGNVFILSNKPSAARSSWFQNNLPDIIFIGGVRKKPYPDGLRRVAEISGHGAGEVALLDDRLLTGGLACLLAGAHFIYITSPYTDRSAHPYKERFFAFLRSLEKSMARFAARKN